MFPYVMGLVQGGPNPDNAKKVLDFVLSDRSQAMWGTAFLRPVFADKMSAEAGRRFLPAAEYARARRTRLFLETGSDRPVVVETTERRPFARGDTIHLAVDPGGLLALGGTS